MHSNSFQKYQEHNNNNNSYNYILDNLGIFYNNADHNLSMSNLNFSLITNYTSNISHTFLRDSYKSYLNSKTIERNYFRNYQYPAFEINKISRLIIYNKLPKTNTNTFDYFFPIIIDNNSDTKGSFFLSYMLQYEDDNSLISRLKKAKIVQNVSTEIITINK